MERSKSAESAPSDPPTLVRILLPPDLTEDEENQLVDAIGEFLVQRPIVSLPPKT